MSEVNVPLLRKAVEWAEVEATKPFADCLWYQGAWILNEGQAVKDETTETFEVKCGTAYCIAGWITAETLRPNEYMDAEGDVFDKDTGYKVIGCEERALSELGLDSDWIDEDGYRCLFDGGNSIGDVREIAEELAGEKL